MYVPKDSNSAFDKWEIPPKRLKPIFGFDSRRSFFAGRGVKLFGIRGGVQYYDKYRTGIGIYGFNQPLIMRDIPVEQPDYDLNDPRTRYQVSYVGLFYERIWHSHRRWEITTPAYLGIGGLNIEYMDTTGQFSFLQSGGFTMMEVDGSAQFKVFTWLALHAGLGYRVVFSNELQLQKAFNGATYSFGIGILIGPLWREIFGYKEEKESGADG